MWIWTPSVTWFFGPTRVLNPNNTSIGSGVSACLTTVTGRQTDRSRYSVCNNRPHLHVCTYYVMQTTISYSNFIMAAHSNGQAIIFYPCGFYLSSFYLFSSPNLSGRRLDSYHTTIHDVALVRIWNASLKCGECGSLKIHDAKSRQKIAISALSHNFVGLYLRN